MKSTISYLILDQKPAFIVGNRDLATSDLLLWQDKFTHLPVNVRVREMKFNTTANIVVETKQSVEVK